jgi:hypothetical protein
MGGRTERGVDGDHVEVLTGGGDGGRRPESEVNGGGELGHKGRRRSNGGPVRRRRS